MSIATALDNWATRREHKRAERWYKYYEKKPQRLAPTPRTCNRLFIVYAGSILVGLISAVGALFNSNFLLLWSLSTLGVTLAAVGLAYQTKGKVNAPLEVLDEYEASVVNKWRKLTYELFSTISVLYCCAIVLISSLIDDGNQFLGKTAPAWCYFTSLLFFLSAFAVLILPLVGYSATFITNDNADSVDNADIIERESSEYGVGTADRVDHADRANHADHTNQAQDHTGPWD